MEYKNLDDSGQSVSPPIDTQEFDQSATSQSAKTSVSCPPKGSITCR